MCLVIFDHISGHHKMCGSTSTDDGMNNSTCNWVNYTKFYTTSYHIIIPHHIIATVGAM